MWAEAFTGSTFPHGVMCPFCSDIGEFYSGQADGKSHFVVFDGGPDPDLWRQNAKKLGVPMEKIEAVILSHW